MQVNMLEAKTQLSKLVDAALRGEEVVIANRGKAVVKLVKVDSKPKRQWGAWAGLMTEAEIDAAFTPELDAEIAREFMNNIEQPFDEQVKPRGRKSVKTVKAVKAAAKTPARSTPAVTAKPAKSVPTGRRARVK